MAKFDGEIDFSDYSFHAAEPISFLGAWMLKFYNP